MPTSPEIATQIAAGTAHVKIRTPRHAWLWFFFFGGFWLVLAVPYVWLGRPWHVLGNVVAGCLWVAGGLWIRSLGVDLTPEFANVRSLRRWSVPWSDVQAVVRQGAAGACHVQLILETGKPVTLRAPSSVWGLGGADYERDFHRIGQWWLDHRGESWRPLRPEAPHPSSYEQDPARRTS